MALKSEAKKISTPRKGTALKDVPGGIPEEHTFLLQCLLSYLQDASVLTGIDLSRDALAIERRFISEGFGFISKTLPLYNEWLRSCFEHNTVLPCHTFKKFVTTERVYPYPAFLRGLVCHVLSADGEIIYAVSPEEREMQRVCLEIISTICNSFGKKYEVPLPEAVQDKQIRELISSDELMYKPSDYSELSDYTKDVVAYARMLLSDLFGEQSQSGKVFDPWSHGVSHGSGAVSHVKLPHEKYTKFPGLPVALGRHKKGDPSDHWLSRWFASNDAGAVATLERFSREIGGISRIAAVPKNSTKIRIVCCEPVENMLVQQGWRKSLYDWVENHPLTRGLVNFTDQEVNRSLVISASRTGAKATIDLKKASDSVTLGHVNLLFPKDVVNGLLEARSHFTMANLKQFRSGVKVRNKGVDYVFNPRMFSPMGSAVCFPVEALTFWSVLSAHLRLSGARDRRVFVYGDDIIVDSEYADSSIRLLAELKIMANDKKSFSKGRFRESCGVDAFDGLNITPCVRFSTRLPLRSLGLAKEVKSASIVSWVEYANRLEVAGYPSPAALIRRMLAQEVPSSKSYPHLSERVDRGFLYFVDYDVQRSYKDFLSVRKTEENNPYGYKPYMSPHRFSQGMLFRELPFFQGTTGRLWATSSEPIEHTDFTEDLRYLRYFTEGSGALFPGQWFVEKTGFTLKRKTIILT